MALTPKSAYGTALKIGNGASSEVFTAIEGCRNFDWTGRSIETIDVTSHSSGSSTREIVPSFINPGVISTDVIFDSTNTQHAQIETDFKARTRRNFEFLLTDTGAEEYAFAAYITGWDVRAPIDDAVVKALEVSIDGAITVS